MIVDLLLRIIVATLVLAATYTIALRVYCGFWPWNIKWWNERDDARRK